jgi:hypothetical protein
VRTGNFSRYGIHFQRPRESRSLVGLGTWRGIFLGADGLPMPALSDTLNHIDEALTALRLRGQDCGEEYPVN